MNDQQIIGILNDMKPVFIYCSNEYVPMRCPHETD